MNKCIQATGGNGGEVVDFTIVPNWQMALETDTVAHLLQFIGMEIGCPGVRSAVGTS